MLPDESHPKDSINDTVFEVYNFYKLNEESTDSSVKLLLNLIIKNACMVSYNNNNNAHIETLFLLYSIIILYSKTTPVVFAVTKKVCHIWL